MREHFMSPFSFRIVDVLMCLYARSNFEKMLEDNNEQIRLQKSSTLTGNVVS